MYLISLTVLKIFHNTYNIKWEIINRCRKKTRNCQKVNQRKYQNTQNLSFSRTVNLKQPRYD